MSINHTESYRVLLDLAVSIYLSYFIYHKLASVSEVSQKSSAAEQRLATSEFVEVSEEEFASVSDLIRGRAKLDDVNRVSVVLIKFCLLAFFKGKLSGEHFPEALAK